MTNRLMDSQGQLLNKLTMNGGVQKKTFVKHKFHINDQINEYIYGNRPNYGYGPFGEFIYYTRYSRAIWAPEGNEQIGQEHFPDTLKRIVEGTFSIRKDWYIKNHISWDENYWQSYALKFSKYLLNFMWSPPGRGWWSMGTPFMYERGSMCLNNCGGTELGDNWVEDLAWLMNALMLGVGVGFWPIRNDQMQLYCPKGTFDFVIPDSREGWVDSVKLLLFAFTEYGRRLPRLIYDEIRGPGLPIKGFGGTSSGPQPLKDLHEKIIELCSRYRESKQYDSVRLKTDIANLIGHCVVAGNVRRSAEIALGSIHDQTFINLKNYEMFPERAAWGGMSNNSVMLLEDTDFDSLGIIAKRIISNGEPGVVNLRNFPFGRIGKRKDKCRRDKANLLNPCGEIPLEDKELCNVVEAAPTRCESEEQILYGMEFATFYASTISLLPTQSLPTNRVIARNRRIGVSLMDVNEWKFQSGVHRVTKLLRKGYKRVRSVNKRLSDEAGVPESIRVTTGKPGGTIPKMIGVLPCIGYPTFHETLIRVNQQEGGPVDAFLQKYSNLPREKSSHSNNSVIYEYPILQSPNLKVATEVTLWEQAMNVVWMQREWADNCISNTLYFKPKWKLIKFITKNFEDKLSYFTDNEILSLGLARDLLTEGRDLWESDNHRITIKYDTNGIPTNIKVYEYDPKHEEDDIEPVLSTIAPLIKTCALFPHSPVGVYPQTPQSYLSSEDYQDRMDNMTLLSWDNFFGSDGQDEKYCTTDICEQPLP